MTATHDPIAAAQRAARDTVIWQHVEAHGGDIKAAATALGRSPSWVYRVLHAAGRIPALVALRAARGFVPHPGAALSL